MAIASTRRRERTVSFSRTPLDIALLPDDHDIIFVKNSACRSYAQRESLPKLPTCTIDGFQRYTSKLLNKKSSFPVSAESRQPLLVHTHSSTRSYTQVRHCCRTSPSSSSSSCCNKDLRNCSPHVLQSLCGQLPAAQQSNNGTLDASVSPSSSGADNVDRHATYTQTPGTGGAQGACRTRTGCGKHCPPPAAR
jgi:hypothetical protein